MCLYSFYPLPIPFSPTPQPFGPVLNLIPLAESVVKTESCVYDLFQGRCFHKEIGLREAGMH